MVPLLRRLSLEQLYLPISAWNPNILEPTKVLHSSISPIVDFARSFAEYLRSTESFVPSSVIEA